MCSRWGELRRRLLAVDFSGEGEAAVGAGGLANDFANADTRKVWIKPAIFKATQATRMARTGRDMECLSMLVDDLQHYLISVSLGRGSE